MKTNTLIVIGYRGQRNCYLNIPKEEAIKRYEAEEGPIDYSWQEVKEIRFNDSFGAYDVWEVENEEEKI